MDPFLTSEHKSCHGTCIAFKKQKNGPFKNCYLQNLRDKTTYFICIVSSVKNQLENFLPTLLWTRDKWPHNKLEAGFFKILFERDAQSFYQITPRTHIFIDIIIREL